MDALKKVSQSLKLISPLLAALVLTSGMFFIVPQAFQRADAYLADNTWQWISSDKTEQRIVVIDIDEASIAHYGAWPWPRERLQLISEKLTALGVRLQAFDMIFVSEQKADKEFAQILHEKTTVLAEILAINADEATKIGQLSKGIGKSNCKQLPKANAYIANNKIFSEGAQFFGHIIPSVSVDGVIRHLPALICYDNSVHASLALSILSAANEAPLLYEYQLSNHWLEAERSLQLIQFPDIKIPLTQKSEILLPWWLAKNAIISISAQAILQDKVPARYLDGAWALIASTAFSAGDAVATPLSTLASGVEVHVQLLSALLDNRLPYQPQGYIWLLSMYLAAVSVVFLLVNKLQGLLRIYSAPLLSIGFMVFLYASQVVLLTKQLMLIPISFALLYIMLSGVCVALYGYILSWLENQRLYFNLSSYLSAHAAKWIVQQENLSTLAAHHECVFVMYVDLRNFSNWCNQLPAEEIAAILHAFYKTVNKVVQHYGGQTEKYVGDAVLCVWRDSDKSILFAAEQLIELLEEELGEQSLKNELPPLAVGIGIEYGTVMVASLGPVQRREYTIIGKAVTTAIQLQEMTTELALPILVGAGAEKKWRDSIPLDTQGEFLLSGASQVMELFTPQ